MKGERPWLRVYISRSPSELCCGGGGASWAFSSLASAGSCSRSRRIAVQLYDLRVPEFEHPRLDELLAQARTTMERHFQIVELSEREMGVVYKNGTLAGVLAPGKRQLYWKGPTDVRVQKVRARRTSSGPALDEAQSLVFL